MSVGTKMFAAFVTLPYLFTIVRLVRRDALRAKYSFLWLLVGTAIIVLSFVPGLLDRLASAVGIAYPPALIFFAAITLLLVIAVHVSWELSRLEERTRVLAEELALMRSEFAQRQQRTDGGVTVDAIGEQVVIEDAEHRRRVDAARSN